jgi:S1-C subfamily serine protease
MDRILQPARFDGGDGTDAVAELAVIKAPSPGATNNVAGSIARLLPNIEVDPTLPGIGQMKGVSTSVAPHERVRMVGRTTGLATGTVEGIMHDIVIQVGTGTARFSGLIVTTPISQVGDSGAPVVNDRDELIGMVYAGSPQLTLIIPIARLLEAFDVSLVQ